MELKKRGRPKKENPKDQGVRIRLTLSEKQKLDNIRKMYDLTSTDILKIGMKYIIECKIGKERGEKDD